MTHVHTPITHEHEIICKHCGVVLAQTIEYPNMPKQPMLLLNIEQHVNGFNKTNYKNFGNSHEKYYSEQCIKVYTRLQSIVQQEHLPAHFASDTMRIILARKRGLWSFKWQTITLIQVLTNMNDKRLHKHIRHLKAVYKDAKGT